MKKNLLFSLNLFACLFLFVGASYAQKPLPGGGGPPGCYDPSQVCWGCYCLDVYDPVCGCNGQTYSNSCYASIRGITSWTEGACGSLSSAEDGSQEKELWFYAPEEQDIRMEVYDMDGNLIATPFEGRTEAGQQYTIASDLPAGSYLCKLRSANQIHAERSFEVH